VPGAIVSAATTTTDAAVGYTAAQAAKLAGCTVSQLRYWSRSKLVTPTDDGGYSFRDLVALRVVRSLLDAGLSSTRVLAALRWVRDSGDDLAGVRLVTDGRTVWACHDDGQILDALRSGQLALFVAVDRVVADVDAEVRAFDAERTAFVEQLRAPSSPAGNARLSGGSVDDAPAAVDRSRMENSMRVHPAGGQAQRAAPDGDPTMSRPGGQSS
jgi:DNA-binding transcriptional MerR regulator